MGDGRLVLVLNPLECHRLDRAGYVESTHSPAPAARHAARDAQNSTFPAAGQGLQGKPS